MKQFLITLSIFIFSLCIICEIVIRILRLVPDVPERYINEYGIQRYKPNQSGYYTKAKTKWEVNNYGWLGTHDVKKDSTISIIGDSYIENIMNPIDCNQGRILKEYLPDYGFFEAGRSGVSFIEAMEISKVLNIEIIPKLQLIYLSTNDFYESISEIKRHTDMLQISLSKNNILRAHLKSPGLKKVLYNIKFLYYLYLKYPVFVDNHNKGEIKNSDTEIIKYDDFMINELLKYCSDNYELKKIIFVFHPRTDVRIIETVKIYGIKTIVLNDANDESWILGNHDGHWSCYGHHQVGQQVGMYLYEYLK